MKHQDQLTRFIIENAPIRGEIVHLQTSYHEVLRRHPYPLQVQQLLGQTLAASGLLSSILKHHGSLILQVQGDGPVSLLLAHANSQLQIRGLANWEGKIPKSFKKAVGQGHLAITIDPRASGERYQGVVELKGKNLGEVIETYFLQSAQLPTVLILAANKNTAAGFLLQLLPHPEDFSEEETGKIWEHVVHLSKTLSEKELLELEPEVILHRLFHQEQVRILETQSVEFVCKCSREAMGKALLTIGYADAIKLAMENQVIQITCEFCNKQLDFDQADVERIFNPDIWSEEDERILH